VTASSYSTGQREKFQFNATKPTVLLCIYSFCFNNHTLRSHWHWIPYLHPLRQNTCLASPCLLDPDRHISADHKKLKHYLSKIVNNAKLPTAFSSTSL
jgi:hypothetical protein